MITILPEEIDWQPFSAFPPSARLAVISGQPSQRGPYTIRVKVPAGVKLMPHRHGEDRIYTVISGTFYIGQGDEFDATRLQAYPPGAVILLPGNTSHFHWAKAGDYITQVSGVGPLGLEYVKATDDPRTWWQERRQTEIGEQTMAKPAIDADVVLKQATPLTDQHAHEIQPFGHLVKMPIALSEKVCGASVDNLNQLVADTMTLRDLYKKHHWQLAGPTFYQLHLLFDKHYEQQADLVDALAERIQLLGGISIAMAHDVAERTLIPRPPKGREEVSVQISRLLHAHEIVLEEARAMARQAARDGDDGTNDLLISNVIRTNELQAWFVAEHVVDMPLVQAV